MESAANRPQGASSGIPEVHFSTEHLPQRHRMAAWQEIFGRYIVNMDVSSLVDAPVESRAVVRVLPGLDLANTLHAHSGFQATRTRELISRGGDDMVFTIVTNGALGFAQLNREDVANAGEAIAGVSDEITHVTSVTPATSESMILRIPRAALSPAVPDIEAACAKTLPAPAVALLRHYVAAAQEPSMLATPDLRRVFVTHVYDLVAVALGATRDATEAANGRGLRAARLRMIKDDILANLRRADLSLDMLAKRHGISPRYIRLLFEGETTSFSTFVRAQRLARAHRMLTSPLYDALAISTIAYDVGFSDLSHFNHGFRHAYNATPSEVRAAAQRER